MRASLLMQSIFEPFPKLARLSRECTITEKIDGTNAQIVICKCVDVIPNEDAVAVVGEFVLFAGSRTRLIRPGKTTDNFGFAGWVKDNASELAQLGAGRHFGEWHGKGIQRHYNLPDKRFALFHLHGIAHKPDCVGVVPTLYQGEFSTDAVETVMRDLLAHGSHVSPGFMNPEGVVIYHEHARVAFKKTFDDRHKEAA